MSKIKINEILAIMSKPENIRNMSVIAHVDHGKSTLTDSLVAKAGLMSTLAAGDKRFTDNRPDEEEKGITIKSTGVSLYYEFDLTNTGAKEPVLLNLIDSPGHVDFSSEVSAALRVSDGALVVVDYVEGPRIQTETVLRQALQEKVKPVLMINKIDRGIHELMHNSEAMYQRFIKITENVNVIISSYVDEAMPPNEVSIEKGSVAFGSGYYGYAFTIPQFARIYAKRFNIDEKTMNERLWGDNFYDEDNKKWVKTEKSETGKVLQRGFCKFIMDPIIKLSKYIKEKQIEKYEKMLNHIGIKLTPDEANLSDKLLLRTIFQKWLPAADALIEMMMLNLPSPKKAQQYRARYLYEGPEEDECYKGIRDCDPNGPLMVYISKMVPTSDKGRFYAFGRVFSGTVTASQKVRILGSKYTPGSKEDLFEKSISRVVVMMGKIAESAIGIPCGNTCGIVGIDEFLVKTGTVTDNEKAYTIRSMKYSVSPVVKVAIQPKNPKDLPKLIEGIKKMVKADPLVQSTIEENGQHIIAGSGDLHVEICLNDLINDYAKVEIIQSEPVVTYKETVSALSSQLCFTKSPNGFNRLYGMAQPLEENLINEIENGKIGPKTDLKERSRTLCTKYKWDPTDTKKLWCFGPENEGPNIIVDQTTSVQYLQEVRHSLETSFQVVSKYSVLAEESMRGVRFNFKDVSLHPDSIHRGDGQIMPPARRLYEGCVLCAEPRLMEPIFLISVTTPHEAVGGVYSAISKKRGNVFSEEPLMEGSPLTVIKGYLPVSESFGFTSYLRGLTSGKAFHQCVFDHWDLIKQDPLDPTTHAHKIVVDIRKRKGLKEELPAIHNLLDKL